MRRLCCCTASSSKRCSLDQLWAWNAPQPAIRRRKFHGHWTDFRCHQTEGNWTCWKGAQQAVRLCGCGCGARAKQRGSSIKKNNVEKKCDCGCIYCARCVFFYICFSLALNLSASLSLSPGASISVFWLWKHCLDSRIESGCRLPTEWAVPSLLQRSFTLRSGRRQPCSATPGCSRRSCPPACVWPRFRLIFYFSCC